MDKPALRVAAYARVSTLKDQKPEIQINELKRYCEARGWQVTEEIIDQGFSGSTDQRPGLKKLMKLARSREVDAVIVLKLDRLFRSLKNLVVTLEEFESLGVKFVATHDQVDMTSPAGRLLVQIVASLGEFERALCRERTMLGLEHARNSGKKLGRPAASEEKVVAIRELRKQGLPYHQIQKQLKVSKGLVCWALKKASAPETPSDIALPEGVKTSA